MPKALILFPFGGNAREALLSIYAVNRINKKWDVIGFIDDNRSSYGKECCGVRVLGGREVLKKYTSAKVLAVPGNPDNYLKRSHIIKGLGIHHSRFATLIDPTVVLSPDSEIGYNSLLMANVVISCGVKIGNHCVILPNTVISHDSAVGDYSLIGSNVSISSKVIAGPNCYIGSGTAIRNNIRIGKGSLIGIGSNVVSTVKDGVVAAGNPARQMRKAAI